MTETTFPSSLLFPGAETFPGFGDGGGGGTPVETYPYTLVWNRIDERYFETGLDRGVLYPFGYDPAEWNGLTGLNESTTAALTPLYADGVLSYIDYDAGDYEASVTALFYPKAFARCLGEVEATAGLIVHNQAPTQFHLSYRTLVGTGATGDVFGYKIHLIYNCTATLPTRAHKTQDTSPDPSDFSFEIRCVPVRLPGMRPTAHYVVDTRSLSEGKVRALERILYGNGSAAARMPLPTELVAFLS